MGRPDLTVYERAARKQGFNLIAGIDEAGRGPLAGPVVAAACIFPPRLVISGVNDSKKLTAAMRQTLFEKITNHPKIHFGIGIISHTIIDEVNIYQATILAMLQAVLNLKVQPDVLLVDGLKLPHPQIPVQKIIGGDGLSQSIAAASIVAKVTRDRMMVEYHAQWPEYGFEQHKGYATEMHREMIAKYGLCALHRRTFAPCKSEHKIEEKECLEL